MGDWCVREVRDIMIIVLRDIVTSLTDWQSIIELCI